NTASNYYGKGLLSGGWENVEYEADKKLASQYAATKGKQGSLEYIQAYKERLNLLYYGLGNNEIAASNRQAATDYAENKFRDKYKNLLRSDKDFENHGKNMGTGQKRLYDALYSEGLNNLLKGKSENQIKAE